MPATKRRTRKTRGAAKRRKRKTTKKSRKRTTRKRPAKIGRSYSWFINKEHQDPAKVLAWYKDYGVIDGPFKLERLSARKRGGYVQMMATIVGPRNADPTAWSVVSDVYKDPDADGNYPLDGHLVMPLFYETLD